MVRYKPLVDAAIELARHKPEFCLVFQRDAGAGEPRPRPRPRLARGAGGGGARALHAGGRHGPALHPLHLRHHRPAEGRGPDQRRPHGGAGLVDAEHLRGRARRRLLGGLGRRLGGRAFLHLLRAAPRRRDHHRLRGQAGRHARRRHLLAGDRRARGQELLHRPDRLPRDQARGSGGRAGEGLRPFAPALSLPRRRAGRPRHHRMGAAPARRAGDRPLVADRDRLGDRGQPGGDRAPAGQARLADRADAGLRRAGAVRGGDAAAGGRARRRGDQAAAAAGDARLALERRRAVRAGLSRDASPATTRPATPGCWTRTAISTSWRAPTTSSTSPATGSRPGRWRRCWRRTRTWRNAR